MIQLEQRGNVTILRLVRGKGNALNIELGRALIDALDEIERGSTKAAVLTGQGSVFGAGVDLPALVAGGPDYVREFLPLMEHGFERLATFPKPLVAAVNGHAIAGGAIIMLTCDQRLLACGTARIGLTEVLVGVVFPAWPLEIARFATPPEHFQTLIMTGRTWQPDDALARGLVDELVEPARLIDRACEVAEEMAAVPAETFRETKHRVRRPMFEAALRQAAIERDEMLSHWSSQETLEQMGAFAARAIKRKG
jgi:enoyl-CoA hydratase